METKVCEAKFKRNIRGYVICAISIVLLLYCCVRMQQNYMRSLDWWYVSYYNAFDCLYKHIFALGNIDVFIAFWAAIVILITSVIILLQMNRCSLTVTNQRVVGKASFGRQVDLPLNKIAAIGFGSFDSLFVATSAGKIKFWLIANRDEVRNAINGLIGGFQKDAGLVVNAAPVQNTSAVDEIKKYKELLDMGVITQEEFDAKKKQLLGL